METARPNLEHWWLKLCQPIRAIALPKPLQRTLMVFKLSLWDVAQEHNYAGPIWGTTFGLLARSSLILDPTDRQTLSLAQPLALAVPCRHGSRSTPCGRGPTRPSRSALKGALASHLGSFAMTIWSATTGFVNNPQHLRRLACHRVRVIKAASAFVLHRHAGGRVQPTKVANVSVRNLSMFRSLFNYRLLWNSLIASSGDRFKIDLGSR